MPELSPAAQAVLDAVCANTEPDCDTQHVIAAALRALAGQWETEINKQPTTEFISGVRNCINALTEIATELEGGDEPTFTPEEIEMIQAPWSYLQSQQEIENE